MVYLAILLVLTGLFIILMVLFSESSKNRAAVLSTSEETPYSGPVLSESIEPEDVDIILPRNRNVVKPSSEDDDLFPEFDSFSSTPEKSIHDQLEDWDEQDDDGGDFLYNSDTEEYTSVKTAGRKKPAEEDHPVMYDRTAADAVLFDDKSNLIDYNSGGGFSGISLENFKNIRRTGRGKLHVDDDGLSFYLGEKLFRFDFHRIHDVWSGPDFIALPLKGSNTVKLFIVDKSTGFPGRVELNFQEYIKGI